MFVDASTQLIIHITIFAIIISGGRSNSNYRKIYLDGTRCPESGKKTEIQLGTQSALLIFNETSISTYNTLKKRNLYCHFELESASEAYGFHFYFEEININSEVKNSSSLLYGNTCNSDYVRFGRDRFGIHIFTSKKYCGTAKRINYLSESTTDNQGNRLYVENQDDDVDVEVNIEKNLNSDRNFNRTLILVVTIFKSHQST